MKRMRLFGMICCLMAVAIFALPVYAATEPAVLTLEVEESVTGDTPSGAETFAFVLEGADGAPMPESDTIYITGSGSGCFLPITYTQPGDYSYTLWEQAGNTEGYTYDDTVYEVTVQVTTDDDGQLLISVCAAVEGSDVKSETIAFENQYRSVTSDTDEASDGTNETSGNTGKTQSDTPKTGDASNFEFWIILGGVAFLGLIVTLVYSLKKRWKNKDRS